MNSPKPCRICGQRLTPSGMACRSCVCDLLGEVEIGTTDRMLREATNQRRRARRDSLRGICHADQPEV